MIAQYSTGEYPKIGDVIRDVKGYEFTVYAFTGTTLFANDSLGRGNYNSDPALYSLMSRKYGQKSESAGSTSPSDDVAAGGSQL